MSLFKDSFNTADNRSTASNYRMIKTLRIQHFRTTFPFVRSFHRACCGLTQKVTYIIDPLQGEADFTYSCAARNFQVYTLLPDAFYGKCSKFCTTVKTIRFLRPLRVTDHWMFRCVSVDKRVTSWITSQCWYCLRC
jgi:hypothetical protein